jgi:chromate transporter
MFAKVGVIGFGGGVGMLALLRNEVVEKRRWFDDSQLSVAVAMGQMLPGPFVSNYAEYIGYELRGWRGMLVAVTALLMPSFALMAVLSFLYFRFGSVPAVARMFSGVQPVVAGILAWATYSIGSANIKDRRSLLIGAIAAIALFFKGDVLLVVVGCGILGIVLSGAWKPNRRMPGVAQYLPLVLGAAAAGGPSVLERAGELALVFLKVGTVIFGGGFAAIPFLQNEVVNVRHWLTMREFIDGVALGQITPGPVAITAAFIGYKVLGLAGAFIAALGTFVPSGLMLWGLIHLYRRISSNVLVQGFLSGVMPAVTGMLLSATVFVGRSAIAGPAQAIIAPLVLVLLLRYRLDPVWLVLAGAAIGLAGL